MLDRQNYSRSQPSRQAEKLCNKLATPKIGSFLLAKDNKIKTHNFRYLPKTHRDEVGLKIFYGTQVEFKSKYPMRYTSFSNREESKCKPQQALGKPMTALQIMDADFNNRFMHFVDSERYRYLMKGISELKRGSKLTDLKCQVFDVNNQGQDSINLLKLDEKFVHNFRGIYRNSLLKRQEGIKIKPWIDIQANESFSSPKIINISSEFSPMRNSQEVLGPKKFNRQNNFQNNFKNKSKLRKRYKNKQIFDELQFQMQLIEKDEFKIKGIIEGIAKNDPNLKQN